MIDFLAKGGVLVGPIVFCSVLALAIFLERLVRLSRVKIRGYGLVETVAGRLRQGEDHKAYELASADDSPMGRILTHGMEVKDIVSAAALALIKHTELDAAEIAREAIERRAAARGMKEFTDSRGVAHTLEGIGGQLTLKGAIQGEDEYWDEALKDTAAFGILPEGTDLAAFAKDASQAQRILEAFGGAKKKKAAAR